MSVCFVCGKSVDVNDKSTVGPKARKTLIKSSKIRGDSTIQQLLENESNPVEVHVQCHKRYSDARLAAVAASRQEWRRIRRDSEGNNEPEPGPSSDSEQTIPYFNSDVCFLCGHKGQNFLKDTCEVKGSCVGETLMNILTPRKDEQSKIIRNRIKDVDLVQVKARYHKKCYTKLRRRNNECSEQLGRPTTKVDKVMEIIFSYIAEHRDVCQFAVKDLLQQIPEDDQPSIETATTRLQQQYKDKIITTNVSGVGKVIFFQSEAGQKLLSDAFYTSRKKNAKAEKERLTREIALATDDHDHDHGEKGNAESVNITSNDESGSNSPAEPRVKRARRTTK